MYEDYNFSRATEYSTDAINIADNVSDLSSDNAQGQIDETTGIRIVERGKKDTKALRVFINSIWEP